MATDIQRVYLRHPTAAELARTPRPRLRVPARSVVVQETRGDLMISFIENFCRIPDGPKVGEMMVLREWQRAIIKGIYDPIGPDGYRVVREAILTMARKNSKLLDVRTPIPTPWGWTTMGDLKPGDLVFADTGQLCTVEATSDVQLGNKCYRVSFSDGTHIIASHDHLWRVGQRTSHGSRIRSMTTQQMVDEHPRHTCKTTYWVETPGPLDLPVAELPIPPYLLGLWLGNGGRNGPEVTLNQSDVDSGSLEVIDDVELVSATKDRGACYAVLHRVQGKPMGPLLRQLSLLGNKHIPALYLRASFQQRLALLQGLIDTDGSISIHGQCKFGVTDRRLAEDVVELVRSLGFKCRLRPIPYDHMLGGKRYVGTVWNTTFFAYADVPVSRLPRKASRQKVRPQHTTRNSKLNIVSIRPALSVATKCITVDSTNHLYLAGRGFTPTHNTGLASGLVMGHLIGPETQKNSRIYSAAYDREQASLVYTNIANMVLMDRFLESQIKLTESKREARWEKMGTIYKALSAESRTKHGLNPCCVILDELGQFGQNRTLYDVLKTAMGVQAEPLMLVISTQAEDDHALMSEMVDYGRSVELKEVSDPTFRLFEFSVPDGYGVFDEKNWYLANPALGDFRSLDEMRVMAERAKVMPSVKRKFENLYLNRRVSMSVTLTTKETWDKNQAIILEKDYEGCPCCMGIDLSSKKDLTALVLVFQLPDNRYIVKPHFFTPADTVDEREKLERVHYREWVEFGFIEAPLGNAIDYSVVAKRLLEYLARYNVLCVAYDRWRMDVLKAELRKLDFNPDDGQVGFLPFGQGYKDMSPALETYEQVVGEFKLNHDGNPVLRFNVGSTVAVGDEAGNRKVDKRNSRAKIDGMVAMIMALHSFNRLGELGIEGPSVYNTRGPISIGATGQKAAPQAPATPAAVPSAARRDYAQNFLNAYDEDDL